MLMGEMLQRTQDEHPDRVALRFGNRSWTYAELDEQTERMAKALWAFGVRPGDRVALFLPNCPELVLSYFGCFKIGAATVPLNYRYRQGEARYALEHSGSKTLIVHPTLVDEVKELPLASMGVERRYLTAGGSVAGFEPFETLLEGGREELPEVTFGERWLAAILYTSGSTARPKGVMYSHETLWQDCLIQKETFELTKEDVLLISTAACHAAAFSGQLLPGLHVGATCVLMHLPTPEEVVRAIEGDRVTRVQMLPASLADLVEYLESHPGKDLSSWRCCTCGGDVVPVELHRRFRAVAGFELDELYGMTEVLSCITNPPFGAKKPGSIGKPAVRTELRVVDGEGKEVPSGETGELLVRSRAMLVGYWNDPEATAEAIRDGWMHTGDLVRVDEDGYYWFVSRKKEIIIRGGSNISPLEVEEVLDSHPAVHLSCVVGVPNARYGQIVAAYVELRKEVTPAPGVEELRQFVADRLAAYKVPERITLVSAMPLNSTGKVDRRTLHGLADGSA